MQRKQDSAKSATLPSLRVDPQLRAAAESVLSDGETLSSFIEQSVRDSIARRRARAEFIDRGLFGRDEARRTGEYYTTDEVITGLDRLLDDARRARRR
jgi:predicted transcriptional regulator